MSKDRLFSAADHIAGLWRAKSNREKARTELMQEAARQSKAGNKTAGRNLMRQADMMSVIVCNFEDAMNELCDAVDNEAVRRDGMGEKIPRHYQPKGE